MIRRRSFDRKQFSVKPALLLSKPVSRCASEGQEPKKKEQAPNGAARHVSVLSLYPLFASHRSAKASILKSVDLMTKNVLSVMSVTEEKQTSNADLSRPYSNKVIFHLNHDLK